MPRTKKYLTTNGPKASFYKKLKKRPQAPQSSSDSDVLSTQLQSVKQELSQQIQDELQGVLQVTSNQMKQMMDQMGEKKTEQYQPRQNYNSYQPKSAPAEHLPPPKPAAAPPYTSVSHSPSHNQTPTSGYPRFFHSNSPADGYAKPSSPAFVTPERHPPEQSPAAFSPPDGKFTKKLSMMEKELQAAQEREQKLKSEIKEIENNFNEEKEKLSRQITKLKQDLHRTVPIQDNKFFSVSKELAQVVSAMNELVEEHQRAKPDQDTGQSTEKPADMAMSENKNEKPPDKQANVDANQKTENQPSASPTEKDKPPETKESDDSKLPIYKRAKFRKIAIPVAFGIGTIVILGGIGWHFLGGNAGVDESLVNQYIEGGVPTPTEEQKPPENQGESQTNSGNSEDQVKGETSPPPAASSSPDEKYANSQADVSFEDTQWEIHKDPTFGVSFDYPKNSSDLVKTDSSMTVIRKTGYIFKIQKIESALDLEEYWKQIKASSLNYKVKETKFRNLPTLALELEDITDYPGDRYLVKKDDYIYDIWYATYSKNLSDDDAKRVDVMLNSLQFI